MNDYLLLTNLTSFALATAKTIVRVEIYLDPLLSSLWLFFECEPLYHYFQLLCHLPCCCYVVSTIHEKLLLQGTHSHG